MIWLNFISLAYEGVHKWMLKQLYKMYSKCWIKLKCLFNYALDGMIMGVCLAWWLAMDLTNMIVHACNYSILVNGELFTPPLSFSLLYFSSHLNPLIRRFSIRIRLELKEPIWCWLKHQEKEEGAQIEDHCKFNFYYGL